MSYDMDGIRLNRDPPVPAQSEKDLRSLVWLPLMGELGAPHKIDSVFLKTHFHTLQRWNKITSQLTSPLSGVEARFLLPGTTYRLYSFATRPFPGVSYQSGQPFRADRLRAHSPIGSIHITGICSASLLCYIHSAPLPVCRSLTMCLNVAF
jgi:hypothetical protein